MDVSCKIEHDHRESEKLFCVFYETFSLQNSCFGAFSSIISNWPPAPALCSCNLLLMGKINQYGQPTVLLIAKRSKGVFFYISAINIAQWHMIHREDWMLWLSIKALWSKVRAAGGKMLTEGHRQGRGGKSDAVYRPAMVWHVPIIVMYIWYI